MKVEDTIKYKQKLNRIFNSKLKLENKLIRFVEKAKYVHNNKFDYSKINYINTNTNVIIICPIHGEFFQNPKTHCYGKSCPKCSKYKPILNTCDFVKKSKEKHGDKYDYSLSEYKNSVTKIRIICKKHGEFFQKSNQHLMGSNCPKCKKIISTKEVKFLSFLKIKKTQNYIKPFLVDGIKGNKIFEFLGDYWHGNPNKFLHDSLNKTTNCNFGVLYKKTIEKFRKLTNMKYKVYYIWERDWDMWCKNKMTFPIKIFNSNINNI